MGSRLFTGGASIVLLGCIGLLGSVAWSFAQIEHEIAPKAQVAHPSQDVGGNPQQGVEPIRDLRRHLPLAGMPQATPGDPDACRRLEGYAVDAVHELRTRNLKPPFAPELLKAALEKEHCAVGDPEVAEILRLLGTAYSRAGLPVVEPMNAGD